jgi:hypothetical protein
MGKIASSNRHTDSISSVTDRWFVAVFVGKHPTYPEYFGPDIVPLLCLFRLQAVSFQAGPNRCQPPGLARYHLAPRHCSLAGAIAGCPSFYIVQVSVESVVFRERQLDVNRSHFDAR